MGRRKQEPTAGPEQLQLFGLSRYLTVDQLVEMLGVKKSFVYRRTARGHEDPIPHYRLGGHLRFHLDDVQEWLSRHRVDRNGPSPRATATQKDGGKKRTVTRITDKLIDLDEGS